MKKVVSVLLALVLVLSITSAMALSYPTNITTYLSAKNPTWTPSRSFSIYFYDEDVENPVISRSSVKSSKTSVAPIYSFSRYESHSDYYYYDSQRESNSNSVSYSISYQMKKAGSANISFKYDGATYKTAVKILNYVNPVSSLKITGVEGGKELKARSAETSDSIYLKVTKTTAAPTLKVKAASGWKVSYVYFSDGNGNYRSFSFSDASMPASVSLPLSQLTAGQTNGYLDVDFENVKTGASIGVNYYFRDND